MSITPLSVTGSGRWLLVGMDTGSVPTEISSPVRTGPLYPRIRSRSSRGPVLQLQEGRGLRHRPLDRLFVPSMALTVWVGTAFSMLGLHRGATSTFSNLVCGAVPVFVVAGDVTFLLASVLLAAWAKTSEAGYLSGWGLDVTMLAIFWDRVNEVLWLPLRSRRSLSRSWLQRPLTLTMYYIWASFVGEFTLADGECDGLLVLTCTVAVRMEVTRIGHRTTRDVRWTTEEQARRDVSMFVIHPGVRSMKSSPTCVLRFRSPFQVRLLREA